MVKENTFGLMEDNTKVIIILIKNKDLAFINGQMEGFIKGIGKMENNTEKEIMYYQMELKKKGYGMMVKGQCGLIKILKKIKKYIENIILIIYYFIYKFCN